MKKILILGGCGYIGTRLNNFLSKNNEVTSVDLEWYGNCKVENNIKLDISSLEEDYLCQFDSIILLAGHSSVGMSKGDMLSTFHNNVLNFLELLKKIKKNQKLIYASSSSVYGDTSKKIVTEEHLFFKPTNYYDLSKFEIDLYSSIQDKMIFGLRFGTVNGFSENFRSDIMINAMTYNAIVNEKIFCFNPETLRPILGIEDLCRAIECIIERGTELNSGIYNLSSFNSSAIKIAKIVSLKTGCELEIVDKIPEEITNIKLETKSYNFMIDSSKFENEFKFKFLETIESIVDSIVINFENMNIKGRTNEKFYRSK